MVGLKCINCAALGIKKSQMAGKKSLSMKCGPLAVETYIVATVMADVFRNFSFLNYNGKKIS